MENKAISLLRELKLLFWSVFSLSALTGGVLLYAIPQAIYDPVKMKAGVNLQTAAVLLLLCCIPLALKLYHKKLVEEALPDDEEKRVSYIRKWFLFRLILIEIALLSNMITYFLTRSTSSLFCCGIALILFLFFCKPGKTEITHLLCYKKS